MISIVWNVKPHVKHTTEKNGNHEFILLFNLALERDGAAGEPFGSAIKIVQKQPYLSEKTMTKMVEEIAELLAEAISKEAAKA